MQAGVDFPSLFDADNYALRHATGHNMIDPESVITGAEIARGMTYTNSHRSFNGPAQYYDACAGWSAEQLAEVTPRVRNARPVEDPTQGLWTPAGGGTEVPFRTRTGRTLWYVWQRTTGKHAYLDCDTDIVLTDAESSAALDLF